MQFKILKNVLKKIHIAFHNGIKYDFHFSVKELPQELEKQFPCLGENTEKYMTFTIPTEKEMTRIDKNGGEATKNIPYILQFIDSARFMASSLSNLVNNLFERIHKIESKYGHNEGNYEACGITTEACDCFLEYKNFKDDLIEYKCLYCNKNYQRKFDEKLKNII